jgi:hypothetical protein
MQIMIYRGKYGDEYWLADTHDQLKAAMRKLFTFLDGWQCYSNDVGLKEAREGDIRAISRILEARRLYEYEEWQLVEVVDPCTN